LWFLAKQQLELVMKFRENLKLKLREASRRLSQCTVALD
jgi:hypothetical protein